MESISIYKKGYLNDVPIPFIRLYLMDEAGQHLIVPFCIYDLAVRSANNRNYKEDDFAKHLIDSYYSKEQLRIPLLKDTQEVMDRLNAFGQITEGDSSGQSVAAVVEESQRNKYFHQLLREYYYVCYAVERVGDDSEFYNIETLRNVYNKYLGFKTQKNGNRMPTFSIRTDTLNRHLLDRKKMERRIFAAYLAICSVVGKSNKVFPATRDMILARMFGVATPDEVPLELKEDHAALTLYQKCNTSRIKEWVIKKVCSQKSFNVRKSEGKLRYGNFFATDPKMTNAAFQKAVEEMKNKIRHNNF